MAYSFAETFRAATEWPYVISLGSNAAPGAPAAGDLHVVGTAPAGAWAGQANNYAVYTGAAWQFTVPTPGNRAVVPGVGLYGWDGAAWQFVLALASTPQQVIDVLLENPTGYSATFTDYFKASTIDAKWLSWAPGAAGQVVFAANQARLRAQATITGAAGTVQWQGIYQELGGVTEFAAYLRVMLANATSGSANATSLGLMVGENLSGAPTTSDLRTLECFSSNVFGVIGRSWTAYNSAPAAATSFNTPYTWLRMRVNGTTVDSDCSIDGRHWQNIASTVVGFNPNEVGICGNSQVAGTFVAGFDNFVMFTGAGTSGINATSLGGKKYVYPVP